MARSLESVDGVAYLTRYGDSDWTVHLYASGVARVLGVSRQRVYELMRTHEDFPEPFPGTKGNVWVQDAIEKWAEGWDRRPGPAPAKERGA